MDIVVVGSGLAGLTAALEAARLGAQVTILTAGDPLSGSSPLAQGGVAAAVGPDDSVALHVQDTLAVGAGLNDLHAVQTLAEDGRAAALQLLAEGAPFDRRDGQPDLALEAAHSRRRVLHGGAGATGRVLTEWRYRQALDDARIRIVPESPAEGLLAEGGRVAGVRAGGRSYRGRAVILASGGYAALWARSTNSAENRGDGALLAWQAGASLADLELVQFHPTALDLPGQRAFLLSEALRGEGAQVVDGSGRPILEPLLPRDVLARAIARFRAQEGPVYLSLRHLDATHVRERFAALAGELARYELDLATDLIPISPAAHYCMGGVRTDVDGRTTVPGLYAAGEVTCTGAQGANRLASNSLLECLVFGARASRAALADRDDAHAEWQLVPLPAGRRSDAKGDGMSGKDIASRLVDAAGVERDGAGLEALSHELGPPKGSAAPLASLVVQAALLREESRGGHYRRDFPETAPSWRGRIHWRMGQAPAFEPITG